MTRDARLIEADSLLQLRGAPVDPVRAAALYRSVADEGDPEATLRSAVFAADGMGRTRDWAEALDLMTRAAELDAPEAQAQLRLLAGEAGESALPWRALRQKVDLAALFSLQPMELLTDKARVFVARGFAPAGFAAWLIEHARARLEPSLVYDWKGTGREGPSEQRTATTAFFGPLERDLIVCAMQERAAVLCRLPVAHHEPPSVISYEAGQFYAAHHDYVPLDLLRSDPVYKVMGQRSVTLVTYLNEDFVGAATQFPRLGFEFRPRQGDAVVFSNVLPNGDPDEDTLHIGAAPESGRKWVLSQWVRSRSLPIR